MCNSLFIQAAEACFRHPVHKIASQHFRAVCSWHTTCLVRARASQRQVTVATQELCYKDTMGKASPWVKLNFILAALSFDRLRMFTELAIAIWSSLRIVSQQHVYLSQLLQYFWRWKVVTMRFLHALQILKCNLKSMTGRQKEFIRLTHHLGKTNSKEKLTEFSVCIESSYCWYCNTGGLGRKLKGITLCSNKNAGVLYSFRGSFSRPSFIKAASNCEAVRQCHHPFCEHTANNPLHRFCRASKYINWWAMGSSTAFALTLAPKNKIGRVCDGILQTLKPPVDNMLRESNQFAPFSIQKLKIPGN